jgi:four helix bundle protein
MDHPKPRNAMKHYTLLENTLRFSKTAQALYTLLRQNKEYLLSHKPLLRVSRGFGHTKQEVRELICQAHFLPKLQTAQRELREINEWLEMLSCGGLMKAKGNVYEEEIKRMQAMLDNMMVQTRHYQQRSVSRTMELFGE